MPVILNYCSDILVKFILPGWIDEANPVLNGENSLNMDLGVGIWHGEFTLIPHKYFVPRGTFQNFSILFYL